MKMDLRSTTLGEICDQVEGVIQTGPFGSQLHESDYSPDGIPVIMPKDIVEGQILTNDIARVAGVHIERLSKHKLKPGDIVYGRRGDIGRQALIRDEQAGWLCGTGCLKLSLGNSVVEPLYLHYYLRQGSVIKWISNQAVGATLPNLNTSILRSVPISIPSITFQRRIIAILSAYDDLIENHLRRIKILEEMARLVYREWFVNFRFPGHKQVPMIDSAIGNVPKGWEVKQVSEVAVICRGRSYGSNDLVDEGALPFVNLKCINREGGFRNDGVKRYQGQFKDSQTVELGDIVMAVTDMTQERRIVARPAMIPFLGMGPYVFSMDLVKLQAKPDIPKPYLYGLLRYTDFSERVKSYANGVNVLHLSPDHIGSYAFILPPPELRHSYAEHAESVLRQADLYQQKNAVLRKTKDLLLPRLISGQLDLNQMEKSTRS